MARIDWVRQRLEAWSRWSRSRESAALGYPTKSSFLRVGSSGTASGSAVPVTDIEASITDDAVTAMRFTHPHLWLTLKCHYIDGHEIKRVALRLCKAESTIKAHLEQADHRIAAWLDERSSKKLQK